MNKFEFLPLIVLNLPLFLGGLSFTMAFILAAYREFTFFSFQLDYKVDAKKLKQVFKLAGQVMDVELSLDKDGNSRGFAVVEYQHPVEAVQAISMLDHQLLYDRRMTVRMDKITKEKLPDGLGGIGRLNMFIIINLHCFSVVQKNQNQIIELLSF